MKKFRLTTILIFCLIGLFAATVFAQGAEQNNALPLGQLPYAQRQLQDPTLPLPEQVVLSQSQAQQGQDQPGQSQNRLQTAVQVREVIQQIREQRNQILQLRTENNGFCEQLRQQLRAFREEGREIDDELAARLREQMRVIREERKELGQSLGQIRAISLEVRAKRAAGQYEAIPNLLQGMLNVQQNRIRLLQEINRELQNMLTTLG